MGGSYVAPNVLDHKAKLLYYRHADDTSGVTWGGQTYETADARVSGIETLETVDICAGVDIQDTEVVLLNFLCEQDGLGL